MHNAIVSDSHHQNEACQTDSHNCGGAAFYARKQLLLSQRLSHRNSVRLFVRPSVCPSVTRVDQSKTVQARITKSSPSAGRL